MASTSNPSVKEPTPSFLSTTTTLIPNSSTPSTQITTQKQTQEQPQEQPPLTELYLLTPGFLGLGGIADATAGPAYAARSGKDIKFHTDKKQPPIYNITTSGLIGHITTMKLRSGSVKKGDWIAKGKFDKFSGDTELWFPFLGQIDGKKEGGEDERMMTKKEGKGVYTFDYEGGKFSWVKTPPNNHVSSFANPDWRLIEEEGGGGTGGEVHAVFVHTFDGSSEAGKMQFRRRSEGSEGRRREWDFVVLLTLGVVVERVRQKKVWRGRAGPFSINPS